jgi:hypothetical protein
LKRLLIGFFPVLLLLGCNASIPDATAWPAETVTTEALAQSPESRMMSVWVFFTPAADENMTPVPAARTIPETDSREELLQLTLKELVKGPTDTERAKELTSWFSPVTADAVSDVVWDGDFYTVVFQGLNTLIPNASTSAGSQMLLSQLNSTVFQFDFVESVNYTLEGNCDDFWQWLQRDCHIVTRVEWETG